jgi:hypothetical protein
MPKWLKWVLIALAAIVALPLLLAFVARALAGSTGGLFTSPAQYQAQSEAAKYGMMSSLIGAGISSFTKLTGELIEHGKDWTDTEESPMVIHGNTD